MKKCIIIILLLCSVSLFSQKSSTQKFGPKAKNSKIWNQKKVNTIISVNSFKTEKLTSPRLKNQKIWEKKKSDSKIIIQRDFRRRNLKGPKAKNFKH